MTTAPRELHINTAFGPSLAAAKILACQPDEWEEDEGHQRSFVLELRGDRAQIVETLDKPVYESWRSDSGAAYCTSSDGELWVFNQGSWARERVTKERARLDKIWGLSGHSPEADVLFVTSVTSLYIRTAGSWEAQPLPEQLELINGLHGLSATEIYLATDYGLWLWNGLSLTAVDGPLEDLKSVRVLSDDEMIVTGDQIHRWTKAEGWSAIAGDHEATIAITTLGDDLMIGTMAGVARMQGERVMVETKGYCNFLARVGDELIASGEQPLVYTQAAWSPFSMPALAHNQKP